MDRRGEVVGLVSDLAACGAGRSGLASVVLAEGVAALRRGQTLAGLLGYTGHGSLLGCDVRARLYPPLHRGGSPRRNPKKRQESNLEVEQEVVAPRGPRGPAVQEADRWPPEKIEAHGLRLGTTLPRSASRKLYVTSFML